MMRWAEGFDSTLVGFSLQTLEVDPSPIFAITGRYQLLYYNLAYQAFAEENSGAATVLERYPIGSNVLGAIEGEARARYQERFAEVMQGGSPWFHEFSCSSPDRYRQFRQGAYPLRNGAGLVLISSLMIEGPLVDAPFRPEPSLAARYARASGMITQCSNCRRTLRNDDSRVWDWVPDWAAEPPPHASHTICSLCFDYYWRR